MDNQPPPLSSLQTSPFDMLASRLSGVEKSAEEGRERDRIMHDQLSQLMASINTLSQQVEAQRHMDTPKPPEPIATPLSGSSIPPTPKPQAERDIKVAAPEPFTGSRTKLRAFLAQLEIIFTLNLNRFHDDRTKVLYTVSLLRDGAFNWAEPMLRSDREGAYVSELRNYNQFVLELERMFGDIDAQATAERKLDKLRQTSSARHYVSEFRQASSHLSWGEEALTYKFYSGLKDTVKDRIAEQGRPTDLNQLMKLAVQIDDRIYERFLEKKGSNAENRQSSPAKASPPQTHMPDVMDWQASATSTGPRPHLSQAERDRRKALGLCFYCGSKDHLKRNCPDRLKGITPAPTPVPANSISAVSSSLAPTRAYTPTVASTTPSASATSQAIEFEIIPSENE